MGFKFKSKKVCRSGH